MIDVIAPIAIFFAGIATAIVLAAKVPIYGRTFTVKEVILAVIMKD